MKNTIENKGILVENEIIKKACLGDKVKLTATDHLITLTKSQMTAMDLVKTIDAMTSQLQSLVEILAEFCGDCDDCGHCENMDFEGIHVEPAQYDYDISDVPPHLRRLFSSYGICLGELDALLVRGDVLNG